LGYRSHLNTSAGSPLCLYLTVAKVLERASRAIRGSRGWCRSEGIVSRSRAVRCATLRPFAPAAAQVCRKPGVPQVVPAACFFGDFRGFCSAESVSVQGVVGDEGKEDVGGRREKEDLTHEPPASLTHGFKRKQRG